MHVSLRLTPADATILSTLRTRYGLDTTATVRLALRALAAASLAPANNTPSLPVSGPNQPLHSTTSTIGACKPAPKGGKL